MSRWLLLVLALLAPSCLSRPADRECAVYLGAGMAGLNNPRRPTGDDDNLTVAAGARLPIGPVSLRPEVHAGDLSVLFAPTITWDFPLAGEGLGAIDGHIGLGVTLLSERESNVLGNTSSLLVRAGCEGYLTHGVLVGAALLIAPTGYDHEDLALAGIVYLGLRF